MRPLQARLVTFCQQVLALGVVLAVLTPASGVVSLDIVGPGGARCPRGRLRPRPPRRSCRRTVTAPRRPVTPDVTEVPLTGAGAAASPVSAGAPSPAVADRGTAWPAPRSR